MAFPRETEEQIRRMVLDICQDHIRKILESIREVTLMMDNFANEPNYDAMEEHLDNVRRLKNEAADYKRRLLHELAETGMLLLSREDILRLIVQVDEIADFCEGVAFRVHHMTKRKIAVDDDIRGGLFSLTKNVLKTVTNLREAILSLTYSRTMSTVLGKEVEAAGYAVDELYRDVGMKIIDSKMDFGTVLLLRDVAELLENIADRAEDAIDSTRIIAIGL
ncbi:MAG: DUF47 domain-containing protein [Candidatus Bathyarchaeia archaeon]